MKPEELIRKGIFEQLCIRGFGRNIAESKADEAVVIYRENRLPDGVRFPDLLRHTLRTVGNPVVRSSKQARLLNVAVNGGVNLTRKKNNSKTWVADFGSGGAQRYGHDVIQRLVDGGFLRYADEENTTAVPAGDFDWFPMNVRRIDVRSPAAKEAA